MKGITLAIAHIIEMNKSLILLSQGNNDLKKSKIHVHHQCLQSTNKNIIFLKKKSYKSVV